LPLLIMNMWTGRRTTFHWLVLTSANYRDHSEQGWMNHISPQSTAIGSTKMLLTSVGRVGDT
jgi:hypothetical protein